MQKKKKRLNLETLYFFWRHRQAAQDVALSTKESSFLLKVLEAAGDIFFNSRQDRHKAIPFYRVQYACMHEEYMQVFTKTCQYLDLCVAAVVTS